MPGSSHHIRKNWKGEDMGYVDIYSRFTERSLERVDGQIDQTLDRIKNAVGSWERGQVNTVQGDPQSVTSMILDLVVYETRRKDLKEHLDALRAVEE